MSVPSALQPVVRGYRVIAVILLNTFVLFLLVNLACLVLRPWIIPRTDPVTQEYDLTDIAKIYPSLTYDQITKMLIETWSRPLAYESYTHFKETAYSGRYVHVDPNGFRLSDNQGPWPPDPQRYDVFVFGGSTTFGYGVADDQTVPSFLQAKLSLALQRDVRVYNFGRCFYQCTQERLLFEQLLLAGRRPHLAVFIDGLNDFYFADGAPEYAERFQQLLSGELVRRLQVQALTNLPVFHVLESLSRRGLSSRGTTGNGEALSPQADQVRPVVDAVCQRYLRNKELIERIAAAYRVPVCFVWQPVPTYKYDLKDHLFIGEGLGKQWRSKFGYERMAEIVQNRRPDPGFLWCADMQEDLHEPLYVDAIHYSPKMSERFASRIATLLVERRVVQ